ncbi:MAG: hypothetical protein ABSF91_02265 [Bacteroidota bacterium]|jgi:hypothetical protein
MARKLYYRILDDGRSQVADEEWDAISRLQHWYNSEFIWTAGKLAFKMYAIFPNIDHYFYEEDELWPRIIQRRSELRSAGCSENAIVRQLETENLIIAKKGGYFDGCLASGFTRVAANEWNAYLACEFLLKASTIAPHAVISVHDEGAFIKSRVVRFHNGAVKVPIVSQERVSFFEAMVTHRHVFSVVDPAKYDHFPVYRNTVSDFNKLDRGEQHTVVKDFSWLGFESNYDLNGDDIQGYDLNKKVTGFEIERSSMAS